MYMHIYIYIHIHTTTQTGLFPACSSHPPEDEVTGIPIDQAYDVIFYDKMWLKDTYRNHPLAIHAFGVDSEKTFNHSGM